MVRGEHLSAGAQLRIVRPGLRHFVLAGLRGRYGDVRWVSVALMVAGTIIGWGLVTNTSASWLKWQGYLLGPFGLGGKTGTWAFANLGVVVALVLTFAG